MNAVPNDLADIIKLVNESASESYRSGHKSGYDAGYRAGLKAAELMIAGKSSDEARAETYRNLP